MLSIDRAVHSWSSINSTVGDVTLDSVEWTGLCQSDSSARTVLSFTIRLWFRSEAKTLVLGGTLYRRRNETPHPIPRDRNAPCQADAGADGLAGGPTGEGAWMGARALHPNAPGPILKKDSIIPDLDFTPKVDVRMRTSVLVLFTLSLLPSLARAQTQVDLMSIGRSLPLVSRAELEESLAWHRRERGRRRWKRLRTFRPDSREVIFDPEIRSSSMWKMRPPFPTP